MGGRGKSLATVMTNERIDYGADMLMSAPPCGAANGRPDFNWNRKKKGRVRFFKSH